MTRRCSGRAHALPFLGVVESRESEASSGFAAGRRTPLNADPFRRHLGTSCLT